MEITDKDKERMLDSIYFNNKLYGDEKELRHILKTMSFVDRKYFVLKEDKKHPYEDIPYLIGFGQTISQPTTVARMLLLSGIKKGMNVLEIGSGSGWNASILAYLCSPGEVVSVERIKKLSEMARDNFKKFQNAKNKKNFSKLNLKFIEGSIFRQKSIIKNKYEVILVTAAADKRLVDKLKLFNFSRMIIPTQEGYLQVWQKRGKKVFLKMEERGYAFVPLIEN